MHKSILEQITNIICLKNMKLINFKKRVAELASSLNKLVFKRFRICVTRRERFERNIEITELRIRERKRE